MKYIKLFEDFNNLYFPDLFGKSLIRGVKIDLEEYIDDPKSRNISTGSSSDESYVNFLKNYKNVGLQDPTKSIHFYLNPDQELMSMVNYYGNAYRVIPEKNSNFSFNIELRNGGLGSTFFFIPRTLEELTDTNDEDYNSDWIKSWKENPKVLEGDSISEYQKFLIKNKVVGNLTYEELLELSKKTTNPIQVWTESRVLHRKYQKSSSDKTTYKKKDLIKKEDFEDIGLSTDYILLFYSSDFGKKIKKLDNTLLYRPENYELSRKEALKILKDYYYEVYKKI
jgi:hypothetical protein